MVSGELICGGAMAGVEKLGGVHGFRSTVHKNARRGHQEREERRTNSPRRILAERSKRRRRAASEGGQWKATLGGGAAAGAQWRGLRRWSSNWEARHGASGI